MEPAVWVQNRRELVSTLLKMCQLRLERIPLNAQLHNMYIILTCRSLKPLLQTTLLLALDCLTEEGCHTMAAVMRPTCFTLLQHKYDSAACVFLHSFCHSVLPNPPSSRTSGLQRSGMPTLPWVVGMCHAERVHMVGIKFQTALSSLLGLNACVGRISTLVLHLCIL